jgi:predicted GNAT superfamily acetyltransferase
MTGDSRAQADKAAAQAGVDVALAATPADARAASALWAAVWPRTNGESNAMPETARALVHAGNYVSIARRGSEVVGASLAFRGQDAQGPYLHSHLAGVLPGLEGRHVGFALKLHQRAWALEQGLDRITWTFDPLVARNAYFNVSKLAEVTSYHVDFYGPIDDDLNAGGASDRGLVTWRLDAPAVVSAASGIRPRAFAGEAVTVLVADASGSPVLSSLIGQALQLQIPLDIVALRARDRACAEAWRGALRTAMVHAYGRGLRVAAVTHDGSYFLAAP